MQLGTHLEIVLPVNDMQTALAFFEGLNFRKLTEHTVTDNCYIIRLTTATLAYPNLVYYGSEVDEIMRKTDQWQANHSCVSPHGINIFLNKEPGSYEKLSGEPLARQSCSLLGKFGEYSIPITRDIDAAFDFWLSLGFKQMHRSEEPYPWGIVMDEQIAIGLHQSGEASADPTEGEAWTEIHLTHFEPDMPARIAKLKTLKYNVRDMGDPDENGQVQTAELIGPGKLKFYLFTGSL